MFIEAEIGFMVRYTIENNKYEGNRINYSSCESPKLTSTTLNTNVITWDKLVTKTRHTTSLDTIPGTTSTTRVDTTQTYKCEIFTFTTTTNVNKDEYMSFYVARTTASYTPPNYNAEDGYANRRYTDSYTAVVSDNLPNGKVSITVQNGYKNQSTWSHSESRFWKTTAKGVEYVPPVMGTTRMPVPTGIPGVFDWIEMPCVLRSGYYREIVVDTTSSSSSSSSSKEAEPVHNIGTSSLSMPLTLGYTSSSTSTYPFVSVWTVTTSSTIIMPSPSGTYITTMQGASISHSNATVTKTYPIAHGNMGTLAFTTLGGLPRMHVVVGSSVINSAYVSYQNYNVESSLFYLGTLNVNVTTKMTSEIEA